MSRYIKGHYLTAAAGATSSSNYTVPQERGELIGFRLTADTADVAANAKVKITIAANGIEQYKEVPLADLNEALLTERIVNALESGPGGTVSITAVSTHSAAVVLAFSFIHEN